MTAQNTGIVLVRLFAIYLAVNALQTFFFFLPDAFRTYLSPGEWFLSAAFWLTLVGILLPAMCASWLWKNADTVVPANNGADEPSIDLSQGMLLGVSLIGLWLLVWGLVSLVRIEVGLATHEGIDDDLRLVERAPYLAQIIISLLLVIARERAVSILLWARYAGRNKT